MLHIKLAAVMVVAGLAAPAFAHEDFAAARSGNWRLVDNPPPVTGVDGKTHAATCSAYPGTDPTYRFWTRRGKSDKLAVFFEGGGACWDDVSCTFPSDPRLPDAVPQFYTSSLAHDSGPRGVPGMFDLANPANPLKDWNIVVVPYCTADVHTGSVDRTYNNAGHPVFPLPPTFQIRHRGFDNFMVVLDWVKHNIRWPEQVLVTGSSAGGYGAAANFPWVAKLYPHAKLSVLADASQGVTTTAFDHGTPGLGSWNAQLAPWVFGSPGTTPPSEFVRAGARAYPKGRFAQYTTAVDGVQIGFYGYMLQFYGPGGACADPVADWNQQMLATLGNYQSELANLRSYVAPGSTHTIMASTAFYDPVSWGPSVAGWLGSQVGGSSDWANVACPECVAPLPCP